MYTRLRCSAYVINSPCAFLQTTLAHSKHTPAVFRDIWVAYTPRNHNASRAIRLQSVCGQYWRTCRLIRHSWPQEWGHAVMLDTGPVGDAVRTLTAANWRPVARMAGAYFPYVADRICYIRSFVELHGLVPTRIVSTYVFDWTRFATVRVTYCFITLSQLFASAVHTTLDSLFLTS